MKKFSTLLQSCDIFGQPIQFTLNRKYLQKSSFGGCMTYCLITTFVLIAFQGFKDLVNRTNITSYTQDMYNSVPPLIDFSSRKLNIAIAFNDLRLKDPRYFNLELIQGLHIIDETGKKLINLNNEELESCTKEHFVPELLESLLQKDKEISNFLCPRRNITIKVEGAYSSPVFSYLWIKLSKCKNTINLTCFSDQKIEEIFSELGRVYLDVYFSNNVIKANDFNNPATSYLDDRIYVLIDRNSYKEKNFFFTENKIFTDSSVLTTDFKEEMITYTYDNINDETIVKISDSTDDDVIYAGIFFRSNILGKMHTRTFEKFGKFIGYIGGFWSLLYLFFSIIARKFNRDKLLIKMANSLYSFSDFNIKETNSHNKMFLLKKININIEKEQKFEEPFEKKIRNFILVADGPKLVSNLKGFLIEKLMFWRHSSEQKMKHHALVSIQKDTDIIHLLKKTKEIDKMKNIFFNHYQKKIFEFFIKGKINMFGPEKKSLSRTSVMYLQKGDMSSLPRRDKSQIFRDILELYKSFSLTKTKNETQFERINEKILRCFDSELLRVFQEHFEEEKNKDDLLPPGENPKYIAFQ